MMSSEEVSDIKNEEATAPIVNEVLETTNEEQPTEQIKEEETKIPPVEQIKEEAKPKAKSTAKKLPRTVKVVELVACNDCGKKNVTQEFKKHTP